MEVAVPDVLTCRATLLTDAYWAIAGGPALPLRSRANFSTKAREGIDSEAQYHLGSLALGPCKKWMKMDSSSSLSVQACSCIMRNPGSDRL